MDELEKLKTMLHNIQSARKRGNYVFATGLSEAYLETRIQDLAGQIDLVEREIALEQLAANENAILQGLQRHKDRKAQKAQKPAPPKPPKTKRKYRTAKGDQALVIRVLNEQQGSLITQDVATLAEIPIAGARVALHKLEKAGVVVFTYLEAHNPRKGMRWTLKKEFRTPLGFTIISGNSD